MDQRDPEPTGRRRPRPEHRTLRVEPHRRTGARMPRAHCLRQRGPPQAMGPQGARGAPACRRRRARTPPSGRVRNASEPNAAGLQSAHRAQGQTHAGRPEERHARAGVAPERRSGPMRAACTTPAAARPAAGNGSSRGARRASMPPAPGADAAVRPCAKCIPAECGGRRKGPPRPRPSTEQRCNRTADTQTTAGPGAENTPAQRIRATQASA